ncbi:MAG: hypothetical protein V4620_01680 [Bacteroidota bacterium]
MNKTNEYNIEEHEFGPFVPKGTKCLIIGTFPTYRDNYANTFSWYYGNRDNMFWKVIVEIFSTNFKYYEGELAIKERKKFFEVNELGIIDIMSKCYRKNKSSSDLDLFPIIYTDVVKILIDNSNIEKIVLTSRTGLLSALGLLKIHFLQNEIEFIDPIRRGDKIMEGCFNFEGREIKVLVPYSPSPRVIKDKKITMKELIKMYDYCLKK